MDDSDLAWEPITSETSYTCPGFDIITEQVRLPDGTETDFDYLSEPPAVVILPFVDEETVVLIEEWREPVERVNRGLPAGTVEPDEPFADAARRELREETGYEADTVESLVTVEPANGVADSEHHVYVAHGCTPSADQDLDHDETIRATETDVEAFIEAVRDGDIRDGRAVLGISYYLLAERSP